MIDRRYKGNQHLPWAVVREESHQHLEMIGQCNSLAHARMLRDGDVAFGHTSAGRHVRAVHIYLCGVRQEGEGLWTSDLRE